MSLARSEVASAGCSWSERAVALPERNGGPAAEYRSVRVILDDEDIEAIAARVAALLDQPAGRRRRRLATAREVAETLGVDRSWVYAHQRQLRAIRLGSGPKSRLRFDLERAAQALDADGSAQASAKTRKPRRRSPGASVPPGVDLIQGKSTKRSER